MVTTGVDREAVDVPTSGPLTPAEMAEAAVLADLAVLIVILARLTPFAGITTVVGAIPFAVLGLRHRTRVIVVAFFVGVVLTFLMAGFSSATQVLVMAIFGGVVGRGTRFDWSKTTTVTIAMAVGWTSVSLLTVGYLAVFANLRRLTIEAASVQWAGLVRFLEGAQLGIIGETLDPAVQWGFTHWYIAMPVAQFFISLAVTYFIMRIGTPTIRRVDSAFGSHEAAPARSDVAVDGAASQLPPQPLPLSLEGASVRRGTTTVQLPDLELNTPEFLVVAGPNGSGKSTLLAALVGRVALASGRLRREGAIGLGLPGGTAVIGQRPESQVVGSRVTDDLAWGLAEPPTAEASADVLARVGLTGFERRETAGLSGGELQRLAIAAALIREPRLLLSDESTAMLDPAAREQVLAVLRSVASEATVVHVTHLEAEVAEADRVIHVGQEAP